MFCVSRVRMQSLKAWEQGSGAPAHRQVVQRPAGTSTRKSAHACVTDLVELQLELHQLGERPTGACQGNHAGITE